MKIDPSDLSLYTDSGVFLKKLHCPYDQQWEKMKPIGIHSRVCDLCTRAVHETSEMTDEELVKLLNSDPEACLMISPYQKNYTIVQT